VRFAPRRRRKRGRKAVRCIIFFGGAVARGVGCYCAGADARARCDLARKRRGIKNNHALKTHISSAFPRHRENFAKIRANEKSFRAVPLAPARHAARTASGGGAYTQN